MEVKHINLCAERTKPILAAGVSTPEDYLLSETQDTTPPGPNLKARPLHDQEDEKFKRYVFGNNALDETITAGIFGTATAVFLHTTTELSCTTAPGVPPHRSRPARYVF